MLRSLIARLRGGSSASDPADDGPAETEDGDQAGTDDGHPGTEEDAGATGADDAGDAEDAEDSNDVWDLIPSWEYDGKYVQSGGHSRGEQERALRDIQRQAAEIEASEGDEETAQDR